MTLTKKVSTIPSKIFIFNENMKGTVATFSTMHPSRLADISSVSGGQYC